MYERNGQGQVVALKRSQLQTPWLQRWASWMLPAQTIVQELQRDLVGMKSFTTGNGIEAQYQRSQNGALARVVYRNARAAKLQTAANQRLPELMGASAQETISWLLGAGAAHAAEPAQQGKAANASLVSAAPEQAARLPGALGLPEDPQALIDHRYLWDTAGNLLYSQGKEGMQGNTTQTSYAYDGQDRLIVASQGQGQVQGQAFAATVSATEKRASTEPGSTHRYHYSQGRRVLSQEGVADASDLKTNTRQVKYEGGSHRWLGDQSQTQAQAKYNANGQPGKVGSREYVWDELGRLIEVRQENIGSQSSPLASYSYNHRSERIGKAAQSQRTSYLYEDGQVSAELNEQGQITRQYVYLAGQIIAVIDTPHGKLLSKEKLRPHGLGWTHKTSSKTCGTASSAVTGKSRPPGCTSTTWARPRRRPTQAAS